MGYYQGDGVVVGGGSSARTLKAGYEYGAHAIRQRSVTSTLRKAGVSLSAAQAAAVASDNLSAIGGGYGSGAWVIFDAEGTRTTADYSQIGGSNLYELNIVTETLVAWQSNDSTRRVN